MSKYKKLCLGFIAGIGILLALLCVLIFFSPIFLESEAIKEKIQAKVSQIAGGSVKFEGIDFPFFPRPHIEIQQISLSIPDIADGTSESLSVYPALLPLLTGRLHIVKIQVDEPIFKLQQLTFPDKKEGTPAPQGTLQDKAALLFAPLAQYAPNLVVELEQGRLDLTGADSAVVSLREIEGRVLFPPTGIKIEIACNSNFWERLSVKIDGEFFMDRTVPEIRIEVEGREVDVELTRDAALALLGQFSTTQDIFEIVKGGTVPLITATIHGSTLEEFGEIENILIKGAMHGGKIFVPEAELNLEDVQGDVVISGGILEGSNLQARLEKAQGREGKLRLGLVGEDLPLHLEANIEADLKELPPLLKRLVPNETFVQEMAGLTEVQGHAVGRLVLGESTEDLKVSVEVSDFNLSTRHQRIPYALEVQKGQLSYDGENLGITGLIGRVGKSTFSDLTAQLSTGEKPALEILSGQASLSLDEIYPWIKSYQKPADVLETIESISGTLALSEMALKGPLLDPESWRFQTNGTGKNLAVKSTLTPGLLEMGGGTFEAVDQKLSFTGTQVKLLDASLTASGVLDNYLKGLSKAEISLQGTIDSQAIRWFSDLIHMPPELSFRAPLSLSSSKLVWNKAGRTSFKANLSVPGGTKVSVDLFKKPGELVISNLGVKDQESDSSLSLDLKEREFHLNFAGNLTAATTERLLIESQLPSGWVRGKFETHVFLDQPAKSTALGKLEGEDLIFPWKLGVTTQIDRISLDAAKDLVKVESMDLAWGDKHLSLKGDVHVSKDGWLVDMDLASDGMEWENIKKTFSDDKTEKEKKDYFWNFPLKGLLRVTSEYFSYGKYRWKPVHAEISLAPKEISVAISKADLCGISFPGEVKYTLQDLSLNFRPVSTKQALDPALTCLLNIQEYMTGTFDLNGDVMAKGEGKELANTLHGNLVFSAENGRIYEGRLLTKIFAYLNVTEIFRGGLPDLTTQGLAYDYATMKGNLEEGKFIIQEMVIDGPTVQIVSHGEINLNDKTVDLKFLVSPLKTVDAIVKKIPFIKGYTKGTLVSIPVQVTGDMDDPKVSYLPSSAVGSQLSGILKKYIKSPFTIISPVIPGTDEK